VDKNGSEKLNRTKINYLIDLFLATLFLSVVSTGLFIYFFMPSGIPRGGHLIYVGSVKSTWVWVHSRAGILMASFVVVHLIYHWKWIVYTTKSFFEKGKKKHPICEGHQATDEARKKDEIK
jgi:hypothetical protein